MSVLTRGLAMDFVRQDRKDMAITSIWPATVCLPYTCSSRSRGSTADNFQAVESERFREHKVSDLVGETRCVEVQLKHIAAESATTGAI